MFDNPKALKAYKISVMAIEGVTEGERSSASFLFGRLMEGTNWEGRTALEWYEKTNKRTEKLKEIMGECDEIFTPELKDLVAPVTRVSHFEPAARVIQPHQPSGLYQEAIDQHIIFQGKGSRSDRYFAGWRLGCILNSFTEEERIRFSMERPKISLGNMKTTFCRYGKMTEDVARACIDSGRDWPNLMTPSGRSGAGKGKPPRK